jgi:hypothetical protein
MAQDGPKTPLPDQDKENDITMIACKLDHSECDHEFTQTNDPDADHCVKCGQSVWAWAFMECP